MDSIWSGTKSSFLLGKFSEHIHTRVSKKGLNVLYKHLNPINGPEPSGSLIIKKSF